MPINGLAASYTHADNGMTKNDMMACQVVANKLNEVIIFRSTGPWSMRWIEGNYPTKNFHVKGKSSDWGPQAGFVPLLGKYSKVGGDAAKEAAGDKYNQDGLKDSYTMQTQLCLTLAELQTQLTRKAAGTTALSEMTPVPNSKDYFLYAYRTSDKKKFAFRAVWSAADAHYKIFVYDKAISAQQVMFGNTLSAQDQPKPLEVMTSSEVGANNKPLTGDYDLMAVCPTWGNLNSRSTKEISKPGVDFGRGGKAEAGQTFKAGVNLDAVLDMRTNTGMKGKMVPKMKDGRPVLDKFGRPEMVPATGHGAGLTAATYNKTADATPEISREHNDMGNVTARILRCVNALNAEMGQSGPFRRVHHNAESHRNVIFGGITAADMGKGEAFPLTVFQPRDLKIPGYDSVFTLEHMGEFTRYATLLNDAGYFVPRSWVWGMSIRNRPGHQ